MSSRRPTRSVPNYGPPEISHDERAAKRIGSSPQPDYGPPQSPYSNRTIQRKNVVASAKLSTRSVVVQGEQDELQDASLAFSSHRASRLPVYSSCLLSQRRSSSFTSSIPGQPTRSPDSRATDTRLDGLLAMVDMLQYADLPGPMMLLNDKAYLAQGAQFVVFKQWIAISIEDGIKLFEVAVKQPKIDVDPDKELQLLESTADKHLKDVYREVYAATRRELKNHPNIAKLLAWSFDPYSFHCCPVLIMEAAVGNMAQILQSEAPTFSILHRQQLCYDVGYGLEAIHRLHIVHGDLKPGNVLVYLHAGRLMAKLSDFGFADVDDSELQQRHPMGGTPGWMAPELEHNILMSFQDMRLAEFYTLGLLVWSVMLLRGNVPPSVEMKSRNSEARFQFEEEKVPGDIPIMTFLGEVVSVLIDEEAESRESGLNMLLADTSVGKSQQAWQGLNDKNMRGINYNFSANEIAFAKPECQWELRPLSHIFLGGLYNRLSQGSSGVKPETLFSIFLYFSQDNVTLRSKDTRSSQSRYKALDAVTASALLSFGPAQAVAERVYKFYGILAPDDIKSRFPDWRRAATVSGCPLARNDFYRTSKTRYQRAMSHFRERGGYNDLHPNGIQVDLPLQPRFADYYSQEPELCLLAAYGAPEAMECFLAKHKNLNLCQRNDRGESALYVACARGSLEITAMLLEAGADGDARMKGVINDISALHWAIAFDVAQQGMAVELLVAHGAQIDWKTIEPHPFYHFPFLLPAGTPLHWAIATCSHEAVRALVRCGADVNARNWWSAYLRDDRIQVLRRFGGPNHESYALEHRSEQVQGLSPLDLAAMQHDPFLFELLAKGAAPCDINASDEEGLTPVHRLGHGMLRHTATGNGLNLKPFIHFSDTPQEDYWPKQLQRTVRAMIALGANLEKLSNEPIFLESKITEEQREIESTGIGAYTPLMYAVRAGSYDVAKALLEAGAQADTLNRKGETALFRCTNTYADSENVRSCVDLLILHGTNVNLRDCYGTAAIVQLAALRDVAVVKLMLAAGASLHEVMHEPGCLDSGLSVLHLLADEDETCANNHDLTVTQMLEEHVFTLPASKQKELIDSAPEDGETILHRYSRLGMLQSMRALIAHDADVNAAHHRYRMERINDVRHKISWSDTPLDEALDSKRYRIEEMQRSRRYSRQQYRDLIRRDEAVAAALREAGAQETCSQGNRVENPTMSKDNSGVRTRTAYSSSEEGEFAWWGNISAGEYRETLDHIWDGDSESD